MDEFKVKAASALNKKNLSVFKLHKDDGIKWVDARLRRESEFLPWQIKFGTGKTSRRFKAIKEGGIGDNASYFVFYKSREKSDTYEVCPVAEWYSVSATQRFKTLTAEEAEEKFEKRHKMLNLFSVMHLKKNGETSEDAGYVPESNSFKVSEMDDWDDSNDDAESGDENNPNDDKKKRKKDSKKEKDDPEAVPEEAKEESDEGDFEQREVDYMSDSSSESNRSESLGEKDEAIGDSFSTDDEDHEGSQPKSHAPKTTGNITSGHNEDGDGSDDSDSDDYDVDEDKMDDMISKKALPAQLSMVQPELQPSTSKPPVVPAKRKRPCPIEPTNGVEKTIEDLIRKYLSRKPMTLKNLLRDIKSKLKRMEVTTDFDNDLVNTIASIIKRLPTEKQKINDVIYLSLKS